MHVGFGTFFQNLGAERSDQDVWRAELDLADRAEDLGFGSVWTVEHHFADYTMSPNPLQFLTWVAARTERVKLGSMVCVLPWHDPVRLAEEASVVRPRLRRATCARDRPRPGALGIRGIPRRHGLLQASFSPRAPRRS